MNKKTISFALAVNHAVNFQEKHFGNAYKYFIYEWQNNKLAFS
jgi:hypothetical protein